MHGLRQTYHRLRNRFAPNVPRLKWKLVTVQLEVVLILTQDRCTVYIERSIGSDVVLDTPDGTSRS